MLKGLGHIGLFVKNVELSKEFYVSLGFEPDGQYLRPNGSNIAFLKAGSCLLELIQPADMSLTGRCAGVIDHICIEVDDIEMEIKKLKKNEIISAHAVAGVLPDMRGGFKNLFFSGPDGERLEYLQSL